MGDNSMSLITKCIVKVTILSQWCINSLTYSFTIAVIKIYTVEVFCNIHMHTNITISLLLPNGINLFSVSIINYNSLNYALWVLTIKGYVELGNATSQDARCNAQSSIFKTDKQQ